MVFFFLRATRGGFGGRGFHNPFSPQCIFYVQFPCASLLFMACSGGLSCGQKMWGSGSFFLLGTSLGPAHPRHLSPGGSLKKKPGEGPAVDMWGLNSYRQLGYSDQDPRYSPVTLPPCGMLRFDFRCPAKLHLLLGFVALKINS